MKTTHARARDVRSRSLWKRATGDHVESHCGRWRITPIYGGCTRPERYALWLDDRIVGGGTSQRECKKTADDQIHARATAACRRCGHARAYHRVASANPPPEPWSCAYPAHQDGSPCSCQGFVEIPREETLHMTKSQLEKQPIAAPIKPLRNAEIAAHPLLDKSQRLSCRVMRYQARQAGAPFTLMDFARLSLRAAAVDYADAQSDKHVMADRALQRAALLFVYEALKACDHDIIKEMREFPTVLQFLEELGSLGLPT